MATIGSGKRALPMEPWYGAVPKLKIPPSRPISQ
jgi:hypothetical protein